MLNTETLRGKISNLNNINASQISPRGPKGDTGATGPTGEAGADGISPTVSISKVGKVTTITITDAEGVHTATINDGNDGAGNGDMQKNVYDTNNNGIVDNAEKVNNHTVNADVPSNAVFTDTVYDDTQILGELGNKVNKETGKSLIEDAKITKLNGIEAGAQVNTITGVKGNSESSYRTGDVNITKNNIGLGNVDNKSSTRIKNEYSSEIAGIDEYDNTSTYSIGNYCIYNNTLYKCITAIAIAEDFDSTKWIQTSITEEIKDKVDKATGKGLSTNDYTTEEKTKLNGIEAGATKNIVASLYDNSSGTKETITLSQSAANFTKIKIYYKDINNSYGNVEVYAPNGKNVELKAIKNGASSLVIYNSIIQISETSLTWVANKRLSIASGEYVDEKNILIVKIEGYN